MSIPTQSLAASEGIFFNISSARKLAADIDYYKIKKATDKVIIDTLKESNNKLLELSTVHEDKIVEIEKDKVIYKIRGDKFEDLFTKCSSSLQDCENSKPSRLVWFSSGVIGTLVFGIVALFLVK